MSVCGVQWRSSFSDRWKARQPLTKRRRSGLESSSGRSARSRGSSAGCPAAGNGTAPPQPRQLSRHGGLACMSLLLHQVRQQGFQEADVQLWEPEERGELQRCGGAAGEGDQAAEGAGAEGEPGPAGRGAGMGGGSRVGCSSALFSLHSLFLWLRAVC